MKISGVTGDGLARLLQTVQSDSNKPKVLPEVKVYLAPGPDRSRADCNREDPVDLDQVCFARVLEVKPETDKKTYLVTMRVYFKVWTSYGDACYLGRDLFLALFRALHENNLPSPDQGEKLKRMMMLLLSLEGKQFSREICENEHGNGTVIVQENTPLTMTILLEKIFPRLEYVELHNYHRPKSGDTLAVTLYEARDIARSLNY